jgi:hypothetical protein
LNFKLSRCRSPCPELTAMLGAKQEISYADGPDITNEAI